MKNKINFISLVPDLKTNFGHHLELEYRFHDILKTQGIKHFSFVSKKFNKKFSKDWIFPEFDYSSGEAIKNPKAFNKNVTEILKKFSKDEIKIVYFYMGGLFLVPSILNIISKFRDEKIVFVLNLFYENSYFLHKEKIKIIKILSKFEVNNLIILTDSPRLYKKFCDRGLSIKYLNLGPIFSEDTKIINKRRKKLNLSFPSVVNKQKGFEFSIHFIKKLINDNKINEFGKIFLNINSKPENKPKKSVYSNLSKKVVLFPRHLSVKEYSRMFEQSDIVILPYMKNSFHSRSSGKFSDSVFFEKPVIFTKDTCVGDLIEKNKIGEVFEDKDLNSLERALFKIKDNYGFYKKNLKKFKKRWIKENSVENYVENIIDISKSRIKKSNIKEIKRASNNFSRKNLLINFRLLFGEVLKILTDIYPFSNIKHLVKKRFSKINYFMSDNFYLE